MTDLIRISTCETPGSVVSLRIVCFVLILTSFLFAGDDFSSSKQGKTHSESAVVGETNGAATETDSPSRPARDTTATLNTSKSRFQWKPALQQSSTMLLVQHAFRLKQLKTRQELDFPLLFDSGYRKAVSGIDGWADGDSFLTNDVAHPMMGAISGYIQIQNDPVGRNLKFSSTRMYWRSRFRALAWSAVYSTNFELGPLSEASLGHVGKKPGTNGLTDFVVTPVGGFGVIVLEDWLDRTIISRLERRSSIGTQRIMRILLNPDRSIANLLRRKVPWHRDNRPLMGISTEPQRNRDASSPQQLKLERVPSSTGAGQN